MLTCPAVHIPTRSLLRSSSTPEPSDPLHSVVSLALSLFLSVAVSRSLAGRCDGDGSLYQHGECFGSWGKSLFSAAATATTATGSTPGRGQTGPRPLESTVDESRGRLGGPRTKDPEWSGRHRTTGRHCHDQCRRRRRPESAWRLAAPADGPELAPEPTVSLLLPEGATAAPQPGSLGPA